MNTESSHSLPVGDELAALRPLYGVLNSVRVALKFAKQNPAKLDRLFGLQSRIDEVLTAVERQERDGRKLTTWKKRCQVYFDRPMGGPALNVSPDGVVGDGMQVIDTFPTKREAEAMLETAGFRHCGYGWKAAR